MVVEVNLYDLYEELGVSVHDIADVLRKKAKLYNRLLVMIYGVDCVAGTCYELPVKHNVDNKVVREIDRLYMKMLNEEGDVVEYRRKLEEIARRHGFDKVVELYDYDHAIVLIKY